MSAPPETVADATAPGTRSVLADRLRRRKAKRSIFERVSIQSKLLLMLLTMSVLATGVAGAVGFESGRTSLRASMFERLTGILESQTQEDEARCPCPAGLRGPGAVPGCRPKNCKMVHHFKSGGQ